MALFEKFDYGKKSKYLSNLPLENIVDNLNNILNTQKHYGSFLNELGVNDFREHQISDEFIPKLIDEIKSNIEKFEPRLKIQEITFEKSDKPLQAYFRVVSIISGKKHIFNIVFDSAAKRLFSQGRK